jgi:hypothetical protein
MGAGDAHQPAMLVDRARAAGIEPLGDAARAIRVAGQEDERRVVALLGAKVDLWHAHSLSQRHLPGDALREHRWRVACSGSG